MEGGTNFEATTCAESNTPQDQVVGATWREWKKILSKREFLRGIGKPQLGKGGAKTVRVYKYPGERQRMMDEETD